MGKAMVAAIAVGVLASFGPGEPVVIEKPGCAGPRHLSIDDVSGLEGDAPARAVTEFVFQVTSSGCGVPMEVPFEVSPIDGTNPSDVVASFGYLRLGAGDLAPRTITVAVMPDNMPEHDEVFAVWIKHPGVRGVVIDKCVGGGTILNDDFGVVFEPKIGSRLHCSE
jgi:hypothetical protein